MAEGKDMLEELEKEITCAICHDHYTEPKVLPCCHYYCKQCLHSLALRTGLDQPFSCPECRKITTLPQHSTDTLPSAFFVNRLKEMHSKLERAYGKVEAKCEMCVEGGKAEAFCRHCLQFMCADCTSHHRKMKMFMSHIIASLEELKVGEAKDIVTSIEPSLQTCTVHEQPMNIYCFDCKTLICRDCTIKAHNSKTHNYEFVKVAAPEAKKELLEQLKPLKELKQSLSVAVKAVRATKSEVEAQSETVKLEILDSFDKLIKTLEDRKQELLSQATARTAKKMDHLLVQEERLLISFAVVQSVVDYTEQSVDHSTDDEIVSIHAELKNRIDEHVNQYCTRDDIELEPLEEADMGVEVDCVEKLKRFVQNHTRLAEIIDPVQHISILGVNCHDIEVGKLSEVHVSLECLKESELPLQCDLKSIVDESTTHCSVSKTRCSASLYACYVQFTPTVRGRHELTVMANGREMEGSPFPVQVPIHPTQLGQKPVRVITGIICPMDVAVNSQGEVIVMSNKQILVYDKSGKVLRSSMASEYDIAELWGIAVTVDSNASIYAFSNRKSSHQKIIKLNSELELINEVSLEGNSVDITGLAVMGDQVLAFDCKSCRIVEFTSKLKRVRQTGYLSQLAQDCLVRLIMHMSSDQLGNLYVTNPSKSCIQVFSGGGKFLRSFGRNLLKWPLGLCVSGQHVFVADYGDHKLLVFTTEGEHVTSFGQRGEGPGSFECPLGMCCDEDGFVYICDHNNCRVQVF